MARLRLHLDSDTSRRALHTALLALGHDVTRTPNEWMSDEATDEIQLLGAISQGRCIFTFNIGYFMELARRHQNHLGIVVAVQKDWALPGLIRALSRFLSETEADELVGQLRWLNDWRE